MDARERVEAERRRLREHADEMRARYGTDESPTIEEADEFADRIREFVHSNGPDLLWPEGVKPPADGSLHAILKLPEEWAQAKARAEEARRLLDEGEEGWSLKDPIASNPDGTWDILHVYGVLRRGFELAGPTVRELRYRLESTPDTHVLVAERNGNGISPGIIVMLDKDAYEGDE